MYISLSTPVYQGKKNDSYRGRARYHHHKPHWYDQVQHCQLGPGSSWWYDHFYLTPVWDHNLGLQSLLTMEGKTSVKLMQNQHGLVCSNIPVTYHERFFQKNINKTWILWHWIARGVSGKYFPNFNQSFLWFRFIWAICAKILLYNLSIKKQVFNWEIRQWENEVK